MTKYLKRVIAVAGPILLLAISINIYLRYADGAGAEVFIAAAIGASLISIIAGSLVYVRWKRRIAQKSGRVLADRYPAAQIVLAELDSRAARALRSTHRGPGEIIKRGIFVIKIEADEIALFRSTDLHLCQSLRVGADIVGFSTAVVNRGNTYNEPGLRLYLTSDRFVDIVLYDIWKGRWLTQEALDNIPKSK